MEEKDCEGYLFVAGFPPLKVDKENGRDSELVAGFKVSKLQFALGLAPYDRGPKRQECFSIAPLEPPDRRHRAVEAEHK